jgi:hypothetical protein
MSANRITRPEGAMASRWVLVLILAVIAGAFVSWFAPLEQYTCDVVFGAQECYITEDEFETTVVRVASGAGAIHCGGCTARLAGALVRVERTVRTAFRE